MKPVKTILASLALLFVVSQARAEYRTVLVQVKQDKDKKASVTIYSDEKKEQKSAVSMDEALKVLSAMQGWGSSVGVYITSEGRMPHTDLKKLLVTIADNIQLDLFYFGDDAPKVVGDHFLQPAGGKETDRGYVKPLVEIKGQLHFPEAGFGPSGGSVRVGDGFGLQVFWLDWSEAEELRAHAKNFDYAWVVLTGRLRPPGSDYVAIGYSGTVTVKTLQAVTPAAPRREPPRQPSAKEKPVRALLTPAGGGPKGDRLAKPVPVEVEGKPLVREHGGLFPFVGDFYGDGRFALLLGYGGGGICDEGRLLVYRNVGTNTSPRLAAPWWFDNIVPFARIPGGG
jgi:hypothetical protein